MLQECNCISAVWKLQKRCCIEQHLIYYQLGSLCCSEALLNILKIFLLTNTLWKTLTLVACSMYVKIFVLFGFLHLFIYLFIFALGTEPSAFTLSHVTISSSFLNFYFYFEAESRSLIAQARLELVMSILPSSCRVLVLWI